MCPGPARRRNHHREVQQCRVTIALREIIGDLRRVGRRLIERRLTFQRVHLGRAAQAGAPPPHLRADRPRFRATQAYR